MHRDAIFSRSLQILASVMIKKRIILADKSTLTGIVSLTYKKKKKKMLLESIVPDQVQLMRANMIPKRDCY